MTKRRSSLTTLLYQTASPASARRQACTCRHRRTIPTSPNGTEYTSPSSLIGQLFGWLITRVQRRSPFASTSLRQQARPAATSQGQIHPFRPRGQFASGAALQLYLCFGSISSDQTPLYARAQRCRRKLQKDGQEDVWSYGGSYSALSLMGSSYPLRLGRIQLDHYGRQW